MMQDKYDALKLENQLCFPLYVCAKEVVRKYKPHLDQVGLTYTQYITMMVLWEHKELSVKDICRLLFLDTGTLTPVLKSLEKKGYLTRTRSSIDERQINVSLTDEGRNLRDSCLEIPMQVGSCLRISPEEAMQLYTILHHMMEQF